MRKVFVVQLSNEEREQLEELVKRGKLEKARRPSALKLEKGRRPSALKLTRARILLKADQAEGSPAYTDAEIAEAFRQKPFLTFVRNGLSWDLSKRWNDDRSKLPRVNPNSTVRPKQN